MYTCILDIFIGCLLIYGHNDLFTERAPGGHVDARFWFALTSIDNLLNLVDFLILEFWEHLFDLEHVHGNIR